MLYTPNTLRAQAIFRSKNEHRTLTRMKKQQQQSSRSNAAELTLLVEVFVQHTKNVGSSFTFFFFGRLSTRTHTMFAPWILFDFDSKLYSTIRMSIKTVVHTVLCAKIICDVYVWNTCRWNFLFDAVKYLNCLNIDYWWWSHNTNNSLQVPKTDHQTKQPNNNNNWSKKERKKKNRKPNQ